MEQHLRSTSAFLPRHRASSSICELWLHRWKKNHLLDVVFICQQHDLSHTPKRPKTSANPIEPLISGYLVPYFSGTYHPISTHLCDLCICVVDITSTPWRCPIGALHAAIEPSDRCHNRSRQWVAGHVPMREQSLDPRFAPPAPAETIGMKIGQPHWPHWG